MYATRRKSRSAEDMPRFHRGVNVSAKAQRGKRLRAELSIDDLCDVTQIFTRVPTYTEKDSIAVSQPTTILLNTCLPYLPAEHLAAAGRTSKHQVRGCCAITQHMTSKSYQVSPRLRVLETLDVTTIAVGSPRFQDPHRANCIHRLTHFNAISLWGWLNSSVSAWSTTFHSSLIVSRDPTDIIISPSLQHEHGTIPVINPSQPPPKVPRQLKRYLVTRMRLVEVYTSL